MFNGGVSFKGDPAKAAAALDEALQCANIVRILKAQSGLPAFTKQFDIKGGGVVTVSDLEYVKHIYIDVSIPGVETTTTSVREEPTKGYDIVPVALFASTDQPLGIYQAPPPPPPPPSPAPPPPETPSSPSSTVKSLSSWSNPPYAPATPPAPPYDLAFAQGASSMIGNVDWSDRRPGGEFYGIVLTWWSRRDSRYSASTVKMTFANEPQAYYGLEPVSSAPTTIWANGVPLLDPGVETVCCALRSETQNNIKKIFLVTVTPGDVVLKFELKDVDVKNLKAPDAAVVLPVSDPDEFFNLENSKAKVIEKSGLDIPESVTFETRCSHANSSGSKMLAIFYGREQITVTEPTYSYTYTRPFSLIVEFDIDSKSSTKGQFTILATFKEQGIDTGELLTSTRNVTGVTSPGRPNATLTSTPGGAGFNYYITPVNSPRNITQTVSRTYRNKGEYHEQAIIAIDYKGDIPVYLWVDAVRYYDNTYAVSSVLQVQESVGFSASLTTSINPNNGNVVGTATGGGNCNLYLHSEYNKSVTGADVWRLRVMHSLYGEVSYLERPSPELMNISVVEEANVDTVGGSIPSGFSNTTNVNFTGTIQSGGSGVSSSAVAGNDIWSDVSRTHTKTLSGTEYEHYEFYSLDSIYSVSCDLRADLYVLDVLVYYSDYLKNNVINNTFSASGTRASGQNFSSTTTNSTTPRTTEYIDAYISMRFDSVAKAGAPSGTAEAGWTVVTQWSYKDVDTIPGDSSTTGGPGIYPSGVPQNGLWTSYYTADHTFWWLQNGPLDIAPISVSDTFSAYIYISGHYPAPGETLFFGHGSSSFDNKLAFYATVRITPTPTPLQNTYAEERNFPSEITDPSLVDHVSKLAVLSSSKVFDLASPDYFPKNPKTGAQLLTGQLRGATRFFLLGPLRNDKDGKYFTKPDGLSTV